MRITFLLALLVTAQFSFAQFPNISSSSDVYHELQKAENDTRVLYVAAHPDDENTRLIAYFENQKHFRTAYLSLTRGDGGQNLIGTEIGAGIGVLRTQELLGARSVDGGEQFFTRAVDFGYSKSSEESFDKWARDSILGDMVWVIRNYRPDVIVTRFPPTDYAGHGHHKASAILAEEAFDLAADPNAYPHQLQHVSTWQTKSMYFNTSTWWIKDLEEQAKNSNDFIRVGVGEYNQLIGESYSQIAARARSQHRSQGFGSDYPDGMQMEYVKYVKGEKIAGFAHDFGSRWEENDCGDVQQMLAKVISEFDFSAPHKSVTGLTAAAKVLSEKEASPFRDYKIEVLNDAILSCLSMRAGLYFPDHYLTPGATQEARLNLNNPTSIPVGVGQARFGNQSWDINTSVEGNALFSEPYKFSLPADFAFSNPYWLNEPYKNTYVVDDLMLIGKPENDPALFLDIDLTVEEYSFTIQVPGQNKEVDPAIGVIYKPVNVIPELTFNFSEQVLVSAQEQQKTIYLTVTNYGEATSGSVSLKSPEGWTVSPESIELAFDKKGASKRVAFEVTASKKAKPGAYSPIWNDSPNTYALTEIIYDHIPAQIILKPSEIAFKPIDLNRGNISKIGYIDGPGDEVDSYLRAAGYEVEIIAPEDLLSSAPLDEYDAIVTGIRAYNTREDLAFANDKLNAYVAQGGTWIVQYNTSRRVKSEKIGPYEFSLSRERVTDEFATPTLLAPKHRAFSKPNKLTDADWEGWVQERGLYFAVDWAPEFTPLIGWNDPGEPSREGGLIVAEYGEGHFVYTGISFFRELPAGVPGAYRLLANLLDLSSDRKSNSNE